MKIRIPSSQQLSTQKKPLEPEVPDPSDYPVTKEFLDSQRGDINRYHIKTMGDGRQFVVNALTGEALERKDAKYFADRKKNILWVPKDHNLTIVDTPIFYPWKNPQENRI